MFCSCATELIWLRGSVHRLQGPLVPRELARAAPRLPGQLHLPAAPRRSEHLRDDPLNVEELVPPRRPLRARNRYRSVPPRPPTAGVLPVPAPSARPAAAAAAADRASLPTATTRDESTVRRRSCRGDGPPVSPLELVPGAGPSALPESVEPPAVGVRPARV